MMQIVWLSRASIAREKAIEWIAKENLTAALNQLDEIEQQVDLLVAHPKLGRIGRVKGTRELVISRTPFIIYKAPAGAVFECGSHREVYDFCFAKKVSKATTAERDFPADKRSGGCGTRFAQTGSKKSRTVCSSHRRGWKGLQTRW
ncbi:MAG: type II toxin-antitoxin system RelE/ParE family toxin [Shewanella oncorhynchi]